MYSDLDLTACFDLLGIEIQRRGEIVVWLTAHLEDGTRRWAAMYKYHDGFYSQSTDRGQSGPTRQMSYPFADMITGINFASLEMGCPALASKDFLQLVRRELESAAYPMTGLNLETVDALSNQVPSKIPTKDQKDPLGPPPREFFIQQDIANRSSSGLALSEYEDRDCWLGNFIEMLRNEGECVYSLSWDSGQPGSGADVEYITEFLGEYWVS
jgi:hypothetical protein